MGAVRSFTFGALMTMALAIMVPVICDAAVRPFVEDLIGGQPLLWLPPDDAVDLVMTTVLLASMFVLGGTMVFRRCGLFGVAGLIAAYILLGDVQAAVMPLLMLVLSMILFKIAEVRKGKRSGDRS